MHSDFHKFYTSFDVKSLYSHYHHLYLNLKEYYNFLKLLISISLPLRITNFKHRNEHLHL